MKPTGNSIDAPYYTGQGIQMPNLETLTAESLKYRDRASSGIVPEIVKSSAKGNDWFIKEENYFDISQKSFDDPMKIRSSKDNFFETLQKWEGTVQEVRKSSFNATLRDLTYNGVEDGWGRIEMEEVTPEDRVLIKPGAIFYWNIGYQFVSGRMSSSSLIIFRRIPERSQTEMQNLKKQALEHFKDSFGK